jgi:hypothetical protein
LGQSFIEESLEGIQLGHHSHTSRHPLGISDLLIHFDRFLPEPAGLSQVALLVLDPSKLIEGSGMATAVAYLPELDDRLAQKLVCHAHVALVALDDG